MFHGQIVEYSYQGLRPRFLPYAFLVFLLNSLVDYLELHRLLR